MRRCAYIGFNSDTYHYFLLFTDIPLTADLEAALKASWQAVVGGEFDIVVSGVGIYLILSLCVMC
jgi:hypothetical protein